MNFHIQSGKLNKEHKENSNILPFEISFQKIHFPVFGNILRFYTTLDVMPKHYIPRMESELEDFGERISRFLPRVVY